MGRFDRSHDRHRADMIDMIRNGSVDTTTLVHGSKKTKGKHDKGRSVRTDAHCDAMTLMESTPRSGRPITSNKTRHGRWRCRPPEVIAIHTHGHSA
jgi:hypothetical protein